MGFRDDFKQGSDDARWAVEHGTRDARWGFFSIFFKFILPISLVVGVVGWGLNIASQPAKIVEQTLSADNVIYNYEWFKMRYQSIGALGAQVETAREAADVFDRNAGSREKWDYNDKQESARLRTIVTGLKNERLTIIAEYNAKSSMVNHSIFMGRELPSHVEP